MRPGDDINNNNNNPNSGQKAVMDGLWSKFLILEAEAQSLVKSKKRLVSEFLREGLTFNSAESLTKAIEKAEKLVNDYEEALCEEKRVTSPFMGVPKLDGITDWDFRSDRADYAAYIKLREQVAVPFPTPNFPCVPNNADSQSRYKENEIYGLLLKDPEEVPDQEDEKQVQKPKDVSKPGLEALPAKAINKPIQVAAKPTIIILDPAYSAPKEVQELPKGPKKDLIERAAALAQSICDLTLQETYTEASIFDLDKGELREAFLTEIIRNGYEQFTLGVVPTSFHQVAKGLADAHDISLPQAYFVIALFTQRGGLRKEKDDEEQEDAAQDQDAEDDKGKEEITQEQDAEDDKGKEEAVQNVVDKSQEKNSPFQLSFKFKYGSEILNTLLIQLASAVEIPKYPENKNPNKKSFFVANFSEYSHFQIQKNEDACEISYIASGEITSISDMGQIKVANFQIFKRFSIHADLSIHYAPDLIRFTNEAPVFLEAIAKSHPEDNSGLLAAGFMPDHPNVFVSTPSEKKASEFALPEFFVEAEPKLRRAEILGQLYNVVGVNRKEEIRALDIPENDEQKLLDELKLKLLEAWEQKKEKLQALLNSADSLPLAEGKVIYTQYARWFIAEELNNPSIESLYNNISLAASFIAALGEKSEILLAQALNNCEVHLGPKEQDYRQKMDKANLVNKLTEFQIIGDGSLIELANKLKKKYLNLSENTRVSNLAVENMLHQLTDLASYSPDAETGIAPVLNKFKSRSEIIFAGLNNQDKAAVKEIHGEILKCGREILINEFRNAAKLLEATVEAIEQKQDNGNQSSIENVIDHLKRRSVSEAKKMIKEGKELVEMPWILDNTVDAMTKQIKSLNTYLCSDQTNIMNNYEGYRKNTEAVLKAAASSGQKAVLGKAEGSKFWRYLGWGLTIVGTAAGVIGVVLMSTGIAAPVGAPLAFLGLLAGVAGASILSNIGDKGWVKASGNINRFYNQRASEIDKATLDEHVETATPIVKVQ